MLPAADRQRYQPAGGHEQDLVQLDCGSCHEFSSALQPGDTLCFITDGVTEAMNPQHEIYGSDRLLRTIKLSRIDSAQALIDALRADVAKHVSGAEPSDDMTLLVIQWTPPNRT